MKKYLYTFKLYFLNAMQYRFNFVVSTLFGIMDVSITILFWVLIYHSNGGTAINSYTLYDMITYFVVSRFSRCFILSAVGFQYANNIKAGSLSGLLLKPYNIGLSMYFGNLGNSIMQAIPQLIAFGLLVSLFLHRFLTWNITGLNAIFLFVFFIVSTVSSHLLWSILGELAFFMEEATAVLWSFTVLLNFLTGYFIPLDFFPAWSVSIIEKLPFSSWVFIPTKIYLGVYTLESMTLLLVVNLAWLPVLYWIKQLLWKYGMKKYSSVGG